VNTASFLPAISAIAMVALSQERRYSDACFSTVSFGPRLRGHSFGESVSHRIWTHVTGDFAEAVKSVVKCLRFAKDFFPPRSRMLRLEAVMSDGKVVAGETRIPKSGKEIRRLRLRPAPCSPFSRSAGGNCSSRSDLDRSRIVV